MVVVVVYEHVRESKINFLSWAQDGYDLMADSMEFDAFVAAVHLVYIAACKIAERRISIKVLCIRYKVGMVIGNTHTYIPYAAYTAHLEVLIVGKSEVGHKGH